MNLISKIFNYPAPFRKMILAGIRDAGIGSYAFRRSIGAIERPHYAYLVFNAAELAKKLGHKKISIIEYGVAGGQGLLALERHAREAERELSIEIEIYGFDTGAGLPEPRDYRDLPYHWKQGFFAMEPDKLRRKLSKAKLVLGNVRDTAGTFFEQYNPAPIGAIIHDFDFYSSTIDALAMLKAGDERYLPRIYCYFDDTIGSETELYNDYTGQRQAIIEFNASSERTKLCAPYHLQIRRNEAWHHQIWIGHFFNHPDYSTFISDDDQQLRI